MWEKETLQTNPMFVRMYYPTGLPTDRPFRTKQKDLLLLDPIKKKGVHMLLSG